MCQRWYTFQEDCRSILSSLSCSLRMSRFWLYCNVLGCACLSRCAVFLGCFRVSKNKRRDFPLCFCLRILFSQILSRLTWRWVYISKKEAGRPADGVREKISARLQICKEAEVWAGGELTSDKVSAGCLKPVTLRGGERDPLTWCCSLKAVWGLEWETAIQLHVAAHSWAWNCLSL